MNSLETFLQTFIKPPHGASPDIIKAWMLHHTDVINRANLSQLIPAGRKRSAHQRKMARQSLRRLILRYPHLANQLVLDSQNGAVQS
jgi:hypothetical protein